MTFTDTSLSPPPAQPLLLATKLHAPPLRPGRVGRQRLFDRLAEGAALPLTLVSAPAGFGKSTLIGDWLVGSGVPFAWLSLDAGDGELRRFLRYVVGALDVVLPGVGRELKTLLAGPELPDDPELLLTPLLNDLFRRDACILMLDDYHLVDSPAVHAAVGFLVERLPPTLRLVIATRADPDLPLPRLRARGLLAEIRAEELRFDEGEAAAFLCERMGLPLSPAQAAALERRTEGWIAGLQLAALSLRGRGDLEEAIASFTGTHRYVLDYLSEEVLASQPPERLEFLLATAVLPRLSGPLCDAVTGGTGGQETLEALEAANLFLIPLDASRTWYRYHHLFGALLVDRLARRDGAEGAAALHRRASDWFFGQGLVEEAMEHALVASDDERAAAIVAAHVGTALNRGELALVGRWYETLSEACLDRHPELLIPQGFVLFAGLRIPELAGVEARLARVLDTSGDAPELAAGAAALRALLLACGGDHEGVAGAAGQALAGLIPDRFSLRVPLAVVLGISLARLGETARALELFAEAAKLARADGNHALAVLALSCQAAIDALHGRLTAGRERCRRAIELGSPWGVPLPAAGMAFCELAEILCDQGELDEALAAAQSALALTRPGKVVGHTVRCLGALARIHLARADFALARELFAELEALLLPARVPAWDRVAAALGARIDLVQGHREGRPQLLARAVAWAEAQGGLAGWERPRDHLIPDFPRDLLVLNVGQTLVKTGRGCEALPHLAAARALAGEERWVRSAIEAALLAALAHATLGEGPESVEPLFEALALAEPEGFLQPFLDEAADLPPLLAAAARQRPEALATPFARRLLTALAGPTDRGTLVPLPAPPRLAAVETVSEREVEILRLIATGLSNAEAARRLYLSPHTVKKHLENLYGKLGVRNRTEAIARLHAEGRLAAAVADSP